ncbi:MAG: RagB/SusD family nutrient uptake outer membrane protein [Ferruginibacter sp.]
MKKFMFNSTFAILLGSVLLTGCTKDLDKSPTNGNTPDIVYSTASGYKQAFAKVYGSFALTGNSGPAGNGDVQGIDEGTSDFLRLFWWSQEISTDEAVVQAGWNDPGIHNFHPMNWSADNVILKGVFYRAAYQITLANDFLRQSTDEKLASRNLTGSSADTIRNYRPEVRFLRAYQYWVLMDLFGNPPFALEDFQLGSGLPTQIKRADLFAWLETELKDLETKLLPARTNEYGRADASAARALLARMYLNAAVYTSTQRNNDAATYAAKVITDGYALMPDYRNLMLADNNLANNEVILSINYDGTRTTSYGGTTFLSHAPVGGDMVAVNYGINGGWAGLRTTKNLPLLFPDVTGTADKRAQFFTTGQSLELSAEPAPSFKEGYAVTKFRNVTKTGAQGSSPDFSDIDFPIFRLGEMYLVYAEAVVRGATTGNMTTAVSYINALRTRAYGNTSGNVVASDLTLNFMLNERARELYWEGFRRSDLIRFDKFTTASYLWPWKGGVGSGTAVASYRNLFPIPAAEINSNPNMVQNPGY